MILRDEYNNLNVNRCIALAAGVVTTFLMTVATWKIFGIFEILAG